MCEPSNAVQWPVRHLRLPHGRRTAMGNAAGLRHRPAATVCVNCEPLHLFQWPIRLSAAAARLPHRMCEPGLICHSGPIPEKYLCEISFAVNILLEKMRVCGTSIRMKLLTLAFCITLSPFLIIFRILCTDFESAMGIYTGLNPVAD